MILKVKVLSTVVWPFREKKHEEIRALMMRSPSIEDVQIDTKLINRGTPEISHGKITEDWFEKNISTQARVEGYDAAIFHCTEKESREWKLQEGLRGLYWRDGDWFIEGWLTSDENSIVRFKDGSKRLRYTKTLPHEIAHGLKDCGLTNLDIHDYDYRNEINNIEGFYENLVINKTDVVKWYQWRIIKALQLMLGKLLGNRPVYPIHRPWFIDRLSQGWMVNNPRYRSDRHTGADWAITNTNIYAPQAGEITKAGWANQVGYYCFYRCTINDRPYWLVFLHLAWLPREGKYKKGDRIAVSGNTGTATTGFHLHMEVWLSDPVNLQNRYGKLITEKGIRENTIDPYKFFRQAVDGVIV